MDKLGDKVRSAQSSKVSYTYIPFYDTVLPADQRHLLAQVQMHPLI